MASSLLSYIRAKRRNRKKVVILGPAGAGKTSFLEGFFGELDRTDVTRRKEIEQKADTVYVLLASNKDESSTTTISMNHLSVNLVINNANNFYFSDPHDILEEEDVEEFVEINFIDNPGQERFDFMSEINASGADGVIIILDGTSTTSLNTLTKYVKMINNDNQQPDSQIPILVFINKADLIENNLFIGSSLLLKLFSDMIKKYGIIMFETSNFNPISFEVPLRTLMKLL